MNKNSVLLSILVALLGVNLSAETAEKKPHQLHMRQKRLGQSISEQQKRVVRAGALAVVLLLTGAVVSVGPRLIAFGFHEEKGGEEERAEEVDGAHGAVLAEVAVPAREEGAAPQDKGMPAGTQGASAGAQAGESLAPATSDERDWQEAQRRRRGRRRRQ